MTIFFEDVAGGGERWVCRGPRGHRSRVCARPHRADRLRAAFVEGMSRSASPVYVLTTAGAAGLQGLTVSAVSSVSADPPMLLACVHRQSPFAGAVRRNGVLAASLLGADQAELADVFAGRHPGAHARTASRPTPGPSARPPASNAAS